MGNQTDYFNRIGYKHVYDIGDRVIWQMESDSICGHRGQRSTDQSNVIGPEVTVHLDLPIQFDNRIYNFIIVKHKDIKEYK
jgi:hypothetical protein